MIPKKVLSFILIAILIINGFVMIVANLSQDVTSISSSQTRSYPLQFSGGDGSANNPYQIANVNELQDMNTSLGSHFILKNDIEAGVTSGWNSGAGFEPIGDDTNNFTGSFDGKGFKIFNLTINRSINYIGLFGYTYKCEISNVALEEINFTGISLMGGLVGNNDGGVINNSYSTGKVSGTGNNNGGLIGSNNGGSIDECYSISTVDGDFNIGGLVGTNTDGSITNSYSKSFVTGTGEGFGGLVGYNTGNCFIDKCYSTGILNGGGHFAGGLIGWNAGGEIFNSYSMVTVSGSSDDIGGFAGLNADTITNCYSLGSVKGTSAFGSDIGGFAGRNSPNGIISNSYSIGSVVGQNQDVGGFVGFNSGSFSNCYSTGSVKGVDIIGGLVGYNWNSGIIDNSYSNGSVTGSTNVGGLVGTNAGTINNCFYDNQTSGQITSPAGTGKYTSEMMKQTTFTSAGWDFVNTWGIFEKITYPHLRWRYPSALLVSGIAYSDQGITPLSGGTLVNFTDNFGLSVAHSEAYTDVNGKYKQIANAGKVLVYISKAISKGNIIIASDGGVFAGLDIYGNSIRVYGRSDTMISCLDLVSIKSNFPSEVILYDFSGSDIILNPSVSLEFLNNTPFELNGNLIATNGGDITFDGPVILSKDIRIGTNNLKFPEKVIGNYDLTLECTGNIVIQNDIFIKNIEIINANDLTCSRIMRAESFIQRFGTGTTVFGTGSLNLGIGSANITTNSVEGMIITGTLELETNNVNLSGIINGSSGQAGADSIILLHNIRIGTHFFNGIDLYKIPTQDQINATEDELYTVDYDPIDPANETSVTWSRDTDASWLQMNSNTGVLSGTPNNDDVGVYWVKVIANDGTKSVSRNFTLEVINTNDKPQILTQDIIWATEDKLYSVYYIAEDVDPTIDTLTWNLQSNADWLFMNDNHLSGTPTNYDVGAYWVNITVSDDKGAFSKSNFSVTVNNTNDAPIITSVPITIASEDSNYSVDFDALDVDANESLNWSLETNVTWLSINSSTGVLNGTPTNHDVGSVWVAITVDDSNEGNDSIGYMLTVKNTNDPPVWTTMVEDQNITEDVPFFMDVLATDVDIGDQIRYSISFEPTAEITINSISGTIRWLNPEPGNYSVNVTASDGNETIYQVFNITVNEDLPPINNPPKLDPIPDQSAEVGEVFKLQISGSDTDVGDTPNLSFNLISGPEGMVMSIDGILIWVPEKDQVGNHNITIQLSDGKDSTTKSFILTVVPSTEGEADETEGIDAMIFYGVLGILIVIIIILILVLVIRSRKREEEPLAEEEAEEEEEIEEEMEELEELEPKEFEPEEMEELPEMEEPLVEEELIDLEIGEDELAAKKPIGKGKLPEKGKLPKKGKAPISPEPTEVITPEELEPEYEPELIKLEDRSVSCGICLGTIKAGLMAIKCKCGKLYHESCGVRVGECPKCDRKFKLEKLAKVEEEMKELEEFEESELSTEDYEKKKEEKEKAERERIAKIIRGLEERLANGEISESTYLMLREKYEKHG